MHLSKIRPFPSIISHTLLLYIILTSTYTHAATFNVQNNCTYTVWAAAVPGGGRELKQGQEWVFNTDPNFNDRGRIWARTNCNFHANGTGKCETGDCDGSLLCVSNGAPPLTLAEYTFRSLNNRDIFDISLVDGFNVPMEFRAISSDCATGIINCSGDINGLCPTELRDPGGCNNPCTVFRNDQFCCPSTSCGPTGYSRFFKDLCPSVYTYALDNENSFFSCPNGTDYKVVFCP